MPSSVIKAAYYRPDEAVLDILFTTGRRYLYHDVPLDEAERFAAASSKGRYFNARIRERYAFTEVAGAGT
ncbi:MAG TPA: KTSC domain-containing protein [Allosphingosinicella sp.]|nr:KTSC domain-containing protein [Allosphingosinicella sp.]